MNIRLLVVCLAIVACGDNTNSAATVSRSTAGDKYVGTVHRDSLPAGLERKGWVYLDSIQGHDYALTAVKESKLTMFWLDQSADTEQGRSWEVVQVLAVDSLPHGYEFGAGTCTSQETPTGEIIALIKREQKDAPAQVVTAWRANRAKHSFDELRTAAVVCK